jgi:hypothetical protein
MMLLYIRTALEETDLSKKEKYINQKVETPIVQSREVRFNRRFL